MKKIFLLTVVVLVLSAITAESAENALVIEVIGPSQGYTDLDLKDKIGFILSGVNNYDIIRAEDLECHANAGYEFTGAQYYYQLPPSIACRYKAEYLIRVKVIQADTYINSSTVLPFVFKSHKRKYKLETELRIIDSRRGEIIRKKKFEESRNGNRSLSYLELDATNEPALYPGYTREMRVFSELEDITARKIAEEVIKTTVKK